MTAWMFWITATFLNGNGWFDLIVGLILDELILAVGVFALLLLVWSGFAPTPLGRLLVAAQREVRWALALVGLLFTAALAFILVGSVLIGLGVWE